MSDKEDQAKSNREAFPFAFTTLQKLQDQFGPGVKVSWASENGKEVGRKIDMSRYRVFHAGQIMINKKSEPASNERR